MTAPASSRLKTFIAARLAPHGAAGLHLSAGLALLLLAAALFGLIAHDLCGARQLRGADAALAGWLHAHATSRLTRAMLVLTHLHSVAGIAVLATLLGLYFFRQNARYWLLTVAIAVPGGMLLNLLLKQVFARARPVSVEAILSLPTYSFPSGHTASAMLLYGIAAAYLAGRARRWWARAAIVAAAMLMALLVGLSRVYLGVHFLSDVLAALAESGAWLALCISLISSLRRHRAGRGLSYNQ